MGSYTHSSNFTGPCLPWWGGTFKLLQIFPWLNLKSSWRWVMVVSYICLENLSGASTVHCLSFFPLSLHELLNAFCLRGCLSVLYLRYLLWIHLLVTNVHSLWTFIASKSQSDMNVTYLDRLLPWPLNLQSLCLSNLRYFLIKQFFSAFDFICLCCGSQLCALELPI